MMRSFAPGKTWPLLALVGVVQIALLAQIVIARQTLINSGHEVVLPVVPVDPRDLFRGDYVVLNYEASRIDLSKVAAGDGVETASRGDVVYITLAPDADGAWQVTGVSMERPAAEEPAPVFMQGRITYRTRPKNAPGEIRLRYGIESYFVPEGTGRALENKVRSSEVAAVVALDDDGTAALKGLNIGGERHLFAPLF